MTTTAAIAIRLAHHGDETELTRLAALDSARPLTGATLIAERGGAIQAALDLDTGRAIANPFAPTADLLALLRVHAAAQPARARRVPRRLGRGSALAPRVHHNAC